MTTGIAASDPTVRNFRLVGRFVIGEPVRMMHRVEHDLLGERDIPIDAYWGVHTLRAMENFPITQRTIGEATDLIVSLAATKAACAHTNFELGLLDELRCGAIVTACDEIRRGGLHDQFVVDLVQGGAGTSTNMNANEVIANRALQLLGRELGDYAYLHPNEHVNLSQSTNDVYPTAIRLALIAGAGRLTPELRALAQAFGAKASEFGDVMKIGRTQLQDAVPMTLGQELGAYRSTLMEDVARIDDAAALLHEINLGATAIGTGITAPPGYARLVCEHLRRLTERPLETAPDLIEATQDAGAYVQLNPFEPIIFRALYESLGLLTTACRVLRERCVVGIAANVDLLSGRVQASSTGIATALNPHIGYDAASAVARDALLTGRGIAELVLERGLLDEQGLAAILGPDAG